MGILDENSIITLSSALRTPSPPSLASRGVRPKKSSCDLFSSTSGETQLSHIFVPKSLNCLLNWPPSHLFQTEEGEKLTCKEEKIPLGQAEASFGNGP